MTTAATIQGAQIEIGKVWSEGGQIRFTSLPEKLIPRLKTRKAEILDALESEILTTSETESLLDLIELWVMRERGETPPSYTGIITCRSCGVVPIFPGVSPTCDCCPWCHNRRKGLLIPRPESVTVTKCPTCGKFDRYEKTFQTDKGPYVTTLCARCHP